MKEKLLTFIQYLDFCLLVQPNGTTYQSLLILTIPSISLPENYITLSR